MDMDPKQIVKDSHAAWAQGIRLEERARYTQVLLDGLPAGARVLDLGCGAGVPTTQTLAQRFEVTGVDISARQLALARQYAPEAHFIQADITQLDLPAASFDAVAAFYSLIHVPRQELAKLLQAIASWHRTGGLLVAAMSAHPVKEYLSEDFLGAPMYWSGYDSGTNRRLVEGTGLQIVSAREETDLEFGRPVTFLWVVARKEGLTQ